MDRERKILVEKLGRQYNMPFTISGVIDCIAIDEMMMDIQAKVIAWVNQLRPEKRLE